jgi:hypothetical protein
VPRIGSESLRTCWRSDTTSHIILGRTDQFSADRISDFNLITIPRGSIKINRKYSVLVEQQSLSPEAFEYWLSIHKDTESVGGLFDPAPSQQKGNIVSLSDAKEDVVGLFESRASTSMRIFITPTDLPYGFSFMPPTMCYMDTLTFSQSGVPDPDRVIDFLSFPVGNRSGTYTTSRPDCIDCRVKGGVTLKPDFWN